MFALSSRSWALFGRNIDFYSSKVEFRNVRRATAGRELSVAVTFSEQSECAGHDAPLDSDEPPSEPLVTDAYSYGSCALRCSRVCACCTLGTISSLALTET